MFLAAPSVHHLFRSLQHHLAGRPLTSFEDVDSIFLRSFFRSGIRQPPERWRKYIKSVMNAHVRPSLFMERIKYRVFLNLLRVIPSLLNVRKRKYATIEKNIFGIYTLNSFQTIDNCSDPVGICYYRAFMSILRERTVDVLLQVSKKSRNSRTRDKRFETT